MQYLLIILILFTGCGNNSSKHVSDTNLTKPKLPTTNDINKRPPNIPNITN